MKTKIKLIHKPPDPDTTFGQLEEGDWYITYSGYLCVKLSGKCFCPRHASESSFWWSPGIVSLDQKVRRLKRVVIKEHCKPDMV